MSQPFWRAQPTPERLGFRGSSPHVSPDAFVAPGAVLIGDVHVGAQSSIWFGCILRGDVHAISVGDRSNIQDGTIVHVTHSGLSTQIGDAVTVGHACVLHACTLEDRAFVGMRATLLDGSRVEGDAMLAAGALLTPGKTVPRGELWGGQPARFMRKLEPEEIAGFAERARHYVSLAHEYRDGMARMR